MKTTHTVHSVEETWEVAAKLAHTLSPGCVIALTGELGAGKTTFMQGLGIALGIRRPVTSPTFTLSVEYPTPRFKLVHMDLYRLSGSEDDLLAIGFAEHLESGAVVAIEWPERAGDLLPADAIRIHFSLTSDSDTRVIAFELGSCGPRGRSRG